MLDAYPFIASSTELSRISQTRWCSPDEPTPPMYMPGRLRTGSSPSRTVISFAEYEDIGREHSHTTSRLARAALNRQSSIVNRHSSIVNHQSSFLNSSGR